MPVYLLITVVHSFYSLSLSLAFSRSVRFIPNILRDQEALCCPYVASCIISSAQVDGDPGHHIHCVRSIRKACCIKYSFHVASCIISSAQVDGDPGHHFHCVRSIRKACCIKYSFHVASCIISSAQVDGESGHHVHCVRSRMKA